MEFDAQKLLGTLVGTAARGAGLRREDPTAPRFTLLVTATAEVVAPACPEPGTALDAHARLLLWAMIEAVKADGQVDTAENARLLDRLDAIGADAAARDWVATMLASPADLEGLAAAVVTPDQAMEVYAAALLAIEIDTPAEHAFLARLTAALALPPSATEQVHRMLGVG